MKKNLHIPLLFLITVLTVLVNNTPDQNRSLQDTGVRVMTNETEKNQRCDIVICLSSSRDSYKNINRAGNKVLTNETNIVDLITGENTRYFFDDPVSYKKGKGDDRIINQAGGTGIVLIRPDFEFTKFSGKKLAKYHTISVSQKTDG